MWHVVPRLLTLSDFKHWVIVYADGCLLTWSVAVSTCSIYLIIQSFGRGVIDRPARSPEFETTQSQTDRVVWRGVSFATSLTSLSCCSVGNYMVGGISANA